MGVTTQDFLLGNYVTKYIWDFEQQPVIWIAHTLDSLWTESIAQGIECSPKKIKKQIKKGHFWVFK